MDLYTLTEEVNQKVADFVREHMEEADVKATVGDDRACWLLWKSSDCVAIKKSEKGRFDYYAGGEYVDKEHVTVLGDYVFYSAEDSRVAGWLGLDEEVDPSDDFNYTGSRHHY